MFGNKTPDVRSTLSKIVVICSFAVLGLLFFKEVPTNNKDILNICIGVVIGASIGPVFGYYFGDSKKEDKIENTEDKNSSNN